MPLDEDARVNLSAMPSFFGEGPVGECPVFEGRLPLPDVSCRTLSIVLNQLNQVLSISTDPRPRGVPYDGMPPVP